MRMLLLWLIVHYYVPSYRGGTFTCEGVLRDSLKYHTRNKQTNGCAHNIIMNHRSHMSSSVSGATSVWAGYGRRGLLRCACCWDTKKPSRKPSRFPGWYRVQYMHEVDDTYA
uniref:Putative secreted protein n=1 Tax=Anopheles darlingi TaxID=43151 RepID=A0A2M4D5S3_ANODA